METKDSFLRTILVCAVLLVGALGVVVHLAA
jgi:hypothetical protein